MRTGDDLRAARERAGLTQEQLARLVGVSHRSIGNWERGTTVPRNRLAKIESILRTYLDDTNTDPLRAVSDVELLAEIARRLARGSQVTEAGGSGGDAAPNTQAGQVTPITSRQQDNQATGQDGTSGTDREGVAGDESHPHGPPVPLDAAARTVPGKSRGQEARERQDELGEQPDQPAPGE